MSTIDNYGVEAGTGELFENRKPGGPEVPTDVTKARMLATTNAVTSGETGGTVVTPSVTDLLNIQIGSLGTGASVFGRKESNTFFFRGIEVEGGLTLHTSRDSVVIGLGDVSVQLPSISDYLNSAGNFAGKANKILVVNNAGTGLTFADSAGGNSNVAKFTDLTDAPSSYAGQAGKMLVVDGTENRLSYAAIPSTGAKGDRGDVGPQGLQGPAGPQGIAGPAGSNGADGAAGPVGAQGIQGAKGDTGETGAQGPQGVKGDTGAKGDAGTGLVIKSVLTSASQLPTSGQKDGDAYITSDNGHVHMWNGTNFSDLGQLQGPKGDTGTAGPQGPTGPKGDTGAAGAIGPQGIPGPVGETGPAGAKGDKGADGAQGPQGIQGTAGPAGAAGATGLAGAKGDKGDTGATGATGPQGPAGTGGGATAFTALTDAPKAYTGAAGKFLAVKTDLSGLEFVSAPSGGTGTGTGNANVASMLLLVNGQGQITGASAIAEMPTGWTFVSNPTTTSIQIRKTGGGRIKQASFWGISNAAGDTWENSAFSNTNFVSYPQDDFDLVTISLAAVANAKSSSGGKVYVDFVI